MHYPAKILARTCTLACILFLGVACSDNDPYLDSDNDGNKKESKTFDFSTEKDVDLILDYSDYEIYGPVRFSVYSKNPLIGEEGLEYVDETIEPLYAGYTNANGTFDATITLPAYAKKLYVVTGYLTIGVNCTLLPVKEGTNGRAVAEMTKAQAKKKAPFFSPRRTKGAAVETDDISKLPTLSYNTKGTTRIYNDWGTPLGKWDSNTGEPKYLMPHTAENIASGLVFSDEVRDGLYAQACAALNSGTTCKKTYRAAADMTLREASKVTITALGSFTCWNSSLGYYYYDDQHIPTKPTDVNIIMLFPNTQDGLRDLSWDYQGNIGTTRGDVVQLKYYPHIASNGADKYADADEVFPMGTKIGFILKPNSWSNLGSDFCSIKDPTSSKPTYWNKKMNIWAASTDGVSRALDSGYRVPNPEGKARTAKFAYAPNGENGEKYTIISMEDACDDEDYDDLIFALNPAKAFTEVPQVEYEKTTIYGVYAFEDLWPSRGDYDMNDVVLDFKHEMNFYYNEKDAKDSQNGLVNKETFYMTTYHNTVELKDGLAFKLVPKVAAKSIVMKKILPGETEAKTANFRKDGDVYYIIDDVKSELGATYIFEVTYNKAWANESLAEFEPFVYREQEDGTQWEVHLPNHAPTSKMDFSLFHTDDDVSEPDQGTYYVRNSIYPFAFYLANAKAEYFMNTILQEGDNKPIDVFYPGFRRWSTTNGAENPDWYLNPKTSN